MSDEVHVSRTNNIQRLLLVLGAMLYKGRAGTIELGDDLGLPRTSVLSTIKRINGTPSLGVTIEMNAYGEYTITDIGKLLNRDTLISMFIEYHGNRYRQIEKARKIFSSDSDDEISSDSFQQATPLTGNVPASVVPPGQDPATKSGPTSADSNASSNTPRPNARRVSIL